MSIDSMSIKTQSEILSTPKVVTALSVLFLLLALSSAAQAEPQPSELELSSANQFTASRTLARTVEAEYETLSFDLTGKGISSDQAIDQHDVLIEYLDRVLEANDDVIRFYNRKSGEMNVEVTQSGAVQPLDQQLLHVMKSQHRIEVKMGESQSLDADLNQFFAAHSLFNTTSYQRPRFELPVDRKRIISSQDIDHAYMKLENKAIQSMVDSCEQRMNEAFCDLSSADVSITRKNEPSPDDPTARIEATITWRAD